MKALLILAIIATVLILLAYFFITPSKADEVLMTASVPANDYRECIDVCHLLYK